MTRRVFLLLAFTAWVAWAIYPLQPPKNGRRSWQRQKRKAKSPSSVPSGLTAEMFW